MGTLPAHDRVGGVANAVNDWKGAVSTKGSVRDSKIDTAQPMDPREDSLEWRNVCGVQSE